MCQGSPHRGHLCHTPLPRLKDHHDRKDGKIVRARVWEEQNKTVSSGHNRTTTLMNWQHLWLPAQDQACQHPLWSTEGFMSPKYNWGAADSWWPLGEGESVLFSLDFSLCIWMFYLHTCSFTIYICGGCGGQESTRSPGTWDTDGHGMPCGCKKSNSDLWKSSQYS